MAQSFVNWPDIVHELSISDDTFLTIALERALRRRIEDGQLPPGSRLPSTRALASLLGVSTATVAAAFSALAGQGVLNAHVGRGTFVREAPPARSVPPQAAETDAIWLPPRRPGDRQHLVARWMAAIDPSAGINLVSGYADYRLPPAQSYRAVFEEMLTADPGNVFAFCPATGHPESRKGAAQFLADQFGVAGSDVFVGNSAHGFLEMVIRALLEPGDVVACESPTYYGMLDLLGLAGIRVVTIPADDEGPTPSGLTSVMRAHQPKLIYLTSCANLPTGRSWTAARRDAVAAVVRQSSAIVVEDGSLLPLRFAGPGHTLKQVDRSGQVIFVFSFSKILFPALRVAVAACSAPIAARLTVTLQSQVRLQAALPQRAVMQYAGGSTFQLDMAAAREVYAARRDALVTALGPFLPVRLPQSGLSLWVETPGGMPGEELCQVLARQGIYALPGDIFVSFPGSLPAVRLAYGQVDEVGLMRAGAAVAQALTA